MSKELERLINERNDLQKETGRDSYRLQSPSIK